ERYWIPENAEFKRRKAQSGKESGVLHPLLHANTSDLSEQRFSSVFTGDEFFLSDHIVKGRRVLPGVATLEMARAAVERAAGNKSKGIAIRLENIVWAGSVTVGDDPILLHIALFPEENGEIAFELFTEPEHGDRAVFSQGSAVFIDPPDTPALDIPSLRAECQSGTVDSARCYDIFKARGIDYGPGFRGIDTVYAGTGKVLAKLRLPASVSGTLNDFALHPSLLGAALQASIDLSASLADEEDNPALPFALESLDSFGPCTASMWAVIRESDSGKNDSENQKIDIDLCDDNGRVCVGMSGFSSRVLKGGLQTAARTEPFDETALLAPVWDTVQPAKVQDFPALTDRIVIIGGDANDGDTIPTRYSKAYAPDIQAGDGIDAIAGKLEKNGDIGHIVWIAPRNLLESVADEALIEGQNRGVIQVFRMINALLNLGYGTKELGWTLITFQAQSVYPNDAINPVHSSVHGLVGSMAKE
ncbi:MAG: polyketide synthase, partial [Gammaproteobacteria bacterium]|nr:polyketide synthase [Gammaproteobacteria bacterium]